MLAKQIIAAAFGMDHNELHDDFPIRTSLDKMMVQDELEENYGVMLTSESMKNANTIQQMVDLLNQHLPH